MIAHTPIHADDRGAPNAMLKRLALDRAPVAAAIDRDARHLIALGKA